MAADRERHRADELTCPSAPPEPGSAVLGVVVGPSQLAYVNPHVQVTDALLDGLRAGGTDIENRMRFSAPCFGDRCIQWSEGRCGLVDRVVADPAARTSLAALPRCGIRATCRWYAQHQAAACAACPTVIRKPAEEEAGTSGV